jgi:hypothetical protein
MVNTFRGANLKFPNRGIHFLLAEIVKFRKQLTERDEFKSQSGWSNSLNNYMVAELEHLADTLENITYNPDDLPQEEIEAQAADTLRSLADDYNTRALASDNVLMPVGVLREVVWTLDGNDPDLPQMTPVNCPNDIARGFLTGLDNIFVELTRLDSRFQTQTITKYESAMIRSLMSELYAVTQRKGGEVNRSDIPSGTLNSQEPTTFQASE